MILGLKDCSLKLMIWLSHLSIKCAQLFDARIQFQNSEMSCLNVRFRIEKLFPRPLRKFLKPGAPLELHRHPQGHRAPQMHCF